MKLRRFNDTGMKQFGEYRKNLLLDPTASPPFAWLEDPLLTEVVADVDVESRKFAKRYDAGVYLDDIVSKAGIDVPERDAGLWTWLTLFFFDQVCPADSSGEREPRAEERLIPLIGNHKKFYRHLLLGPYIIVRAHRDDPSRATALLHNPLWQPGEIPAQLSARKEQVTNPAVVGAATKLYYDSTNDELKQGSGSNVKGGPRRLSVVLKQLELTYYLYGLTPDELIALLPKEFDRFKP